MEYLGISLLALLITMAGCIRFGRGGYDEGEPAPGMVIFGDEYERGPVVNDYAHRGEVSRRPGEGPF